MKKFLNFFGQSSDEETETPPRPKPEDSLLTTGQNKIQIKSTTRRLMPMNNAPSAENIYDSLAFVIFCPQHNQIAVCTTEHVSAGSTSNALWLPFIYLSATVGWHEAIHEGLALILSDNNAGRMEDLRNRLPWDVCILHILRRQLPHTQRYVTRLVSLARLKTQDIKCCAKTSRISWLSMDEIRGGVAEAWGIEIKSFARKVNVDMKDPDSYQNVVEHDLDWVLMYVPREPTRNIEEDLLKNLKITQNHIERLFIDFLEHCFPSFLMSFHSFKSYIKKYRIFWKPSQMSRYFNAFNFSGTGFVNFHEVLLGMACIEPNIPSGDVRTKFIFRYYDADVDGFLNREEFRELLKDIHTTEDDDQINERVEAGLKLMMKTSKGIAFRDFLYCVGTRKFRGTSFLCRSNKSFVTELAMQMSSRGTIKASPSLKKSVADHVNKKKYEGVCNNCRKTKYEVAVHSVLMTENGCSDPQIIDEIKAERQRRKTAPPKNKYLSEEYAMEVTFNTNSLPNRLREQIRAFNEVKGDRNNPKGLFAETKELREEFAKMIEQLATDIIPILESEDRCLKVKSPAVVIGDIHGNLEDLFSIEKSLFKNVPIVTANYIFLGDYVDRGKWSTECAVYILCLKLLAPTNFILLRGNHETRVMQENYTFKKEIKTKYHSSGDVIFNKLNKIFDRLPLAAVIDDTIFCCHGGIPTTTDSIEEINDIPKNLKHIQNESPVAWEMVWNDPVDNKEFHQTVDLFKKRDEISRGFVPNMRRGTAFYFNDIACQHFLKNNNLSHLVRAHEVPTNGFRLMYDERCLTVFSCSHYCGKENKAAVLHVSDQTLRIVELDTKNNAPATD